MTRIRNVKTLAGLFALVLVFLALTACGNAAADKAADSQTPEPMEESSASDLPESDGPEPENDRLIGRWELVGVEYGEFFTPAEVFLAEAGYDEGLWFEFAGSGSLWGEDSGDPFRGSYELQGDIVEIQVVGNDLLRFVREGERLTWFDEDEGYTLVLERTDSLQPAEPGDSEDSSLVGRWEPVAAELDGVLHTAEELRALLGDSDGQSTTGVFDIVFKPDGTGTLYTGAGSYAISYEESGEDVHILVEGADEAMLFRREGNRLTHSDPYYDMTLILERKQFDQSAA